MQRTKRSLRVMLVALLAVILSVALLPMPSAKAAGFIDTAHKGTLNLTHYSIDEERKANVTSHLYLVATIDENGKYTITREFNAFFDNKDFFNNGYNYDQWKDCVKHTNVGGSNTGDLENYIDQNGIKEVANGISNARGETVYGNLALGVYFVRSDDLVEEEWTHSFINFVYPVPILEKQTQSANLVVNYSPSASPKKSKVKNDVNIHCSLMKRWNDTGYSENRPLAVSFDILMDGQVWKTVTLSSENNWTYEWENQGLHDYSVRETNVGNGYSASVEIVQVGEHDYNYICTNTYTPPETPPQTPPTPPETPPTPDTPTETPDIPDIPDFPDFPDIPTDDYDYTPPTNDEGTPDIPIIGEVLGAIREVPEVLGAVRDAPAVLGAKRLPQTGLLWWPLPILIIGGMVLIIKGVKKTNNSKA